jgi:hypothetical protein
MFDDYFDTVHSESSTPPLVWEELLHFNNFPSHFDDPSYTPQLDNEWLTNEEIVQRSGNDRMKGFEPGESPQDEPVLGELTQDSSNPEINERENYNYDTSLIPGFAPEEVTPESPVPDLDIPELAPGPDLVPVDDPPSELRRSTRTRRAPERFTFNKQHGYWSTKRIFRTVLNGLLCSTTVTYYFRHMHTLMLDHERGTLENVIPNCPFSFKAKATEDPDTPNIGKALSGPH